MQKKIQRHDQEMKGHLAITNSTVSLKKKHKIQKKKIENDIEAA